MRRWTAAPSDWPYNGPLSVPASNERAILGRDTSSIDFDILTEPLSRWLRDAQ